MKNPVVSLALLCLLLLAACTDTGTAAYNRKLDQWIGKDRKALVATWGTPDLEDATAPHTRTLTYLKTRTIRYPDPELPCMPSVVHGGPHGLPVVTINTNDCLDHQSPMQVPLTCDTVFTVKNGKVSSWSHKGNDCRP